MRQRKILLTVFTILSIVGYGAFVFAAPSLGSGGFIPGETLNPDCMPGDTGYDCKVQGGWLLGGNVGTDGGIDDFVGTIDAQDFVIKTNGAEIARFGQSGNVALGSALGPYAAPVSSSDGSLAFGPGSQSTGQASIALGLLSQATGTASISIGSGLSPNIASSLASVAIGNNNVVNGAGSFAVGGYNTIDTLSTSSFIFGRGNSTSIAHDTQNSFVVGRDNVVNGQDSYLLGRELTSESYWETVIGSNNTDYVPKDSANWNTADRLFTIGNGDYKGGYPLGHNALTMWKDGSFAYNDDNFQNDTVGEQNMFYFNYGNHNGSGGINSKKAIRLGSSSSDNWDITSANVGDKSIALGFGSAMYGYPNPIASGTKSLAVLSGIASGSDSFAAGIFGTEASGPGSVAFGYGTLASGDYGTTFGAATVASGILATAFGDSTTASGGSSVAFGLSTTASGSNSSAFGATTSAFSYGETALGTQNTNYSPVSSTIFDSADRLLVVGNGDGSASDAFTILKNGKTGIGYDNFETTSSGALLQVNGGILSSSLTSCGLLETDSDGLFGCGTLPSASPITIENTSSLFSTGLSGTGSGSTATYSIFLGPSAGSGATNASQSVFLGYEAGLNASSATSSNFIGPSAGSGATRAYYSTFIGPSAGSGATNAARSIFIGYQAGSSDTVDNRFGTPSSILIGNDSSTGGFSNSIAIGRSATNTTTNQMMVGSSTSRINTLVFNGGTGNTCAIDVNTGVTCSSDERLKTDITDLDSNILDSIAQLRTVTYKWNSGPETTDTHIGFIAQNVQTLFPELVTQNQDGMLSVNYANIAPVLTEGIKELNLKITDIENFANAEHTTFLQNLIAWFADAANGIGKLFAHEVHTDTLCVGQTCVTETQLQHLLQSQGVSSGFGYGYGGGE